VEPSPRESATVTHDNSTGPQIIVSPDPFSDWAGLLALLHSAYGYMAPRIDPPSSLLRMDAAQFERKARDETLIVALVDGELVGCLFARPCADALYLGKLAVHSRFRRRGLARRLMGEAEALARNGSLPFVELETRIELTDNHATFAALGFRKTAEAAHPGYARTTKITMRKAVPAGSAD
jgi:ribosomal protein S18 acetylase RimI-like enzyme